MNIVNALDQLIPEPTLLSGTSRAAVALVLRPSTCTPPLDILLIQRAPRRSDPWSAHIALPGGRRDPSDPHDFATAVREVREEIGLDLLSPSYAFVARLNDRPIRRATENQGVLSAFLFLQLDLSDRVTLQPEEVASSFWLSLRHVHAHSPLFCTHPLHIPYNRDTLLAALCSATRHILGFSKLQMPALNVLPHGMHRVKAVEAPHTVLWGMTLDILGDFVEILGLKRVDRPAVLPDSRVLAGLLRFLSRVRYMVRRLLFYRRPTFHVIPSFDS